MHTTRKILNAVFYIVCGGCAWRLLPHDFPPWKTVYHYFRQKVPERRSGGVFRCYEEGEMG